MPGLSHRRRSNLALPALSGSEQSSQMTRPFRGSKLAQRLRFNLTDAFSGDVKLLPNFLESVFPLAADAEAQADHFLLFRRQGLQNVGGLVADVGIDHGVHGRTDRKSVV